MPLPNRRRRRTRTYTRGDVNIIYDYCVHLAPRLRGHELCVGESDFQ